MSTQGSTGLIGARVRRLEDPRLLTGRGQYLDDVKVHGCLHAAVLRSPYAHARIRGIDVSRALALPGVHAVVTGRDLVGVVNPQPLMWHPIKEQRKTNHIALAVDRVLYVGHAVAAVAAVDRYTAEDALDLIEVDYEMLAVVATVAAALAPGAPILHDGWPDNITGEASYKAGDPDGAFAAADVVIREKLEIGRLFSCPLETRGCIAEFDPVTAELDLWSSTQSPHYIRDLIGEVLSLPVNKIRVRVPELGGGFGGKTELYCEEILAAVLSRQTGAAVKLLEDRRESFVASSHARGQVIEIEIAATRDGVIQGLRGTVTGDIGAQLSSVHIGPVWLATNLLPGPYKVPNISVTCRGVMTNKTPLGAYRGWGKPQANFAHERMIELLAREVGLDRNEVRRRNFVPPDGFPHNNGTVMTLDSGTYADCLDQCLNAIKQQDWHERQEAARAAGRSVGIGYAFHIEATSLGNSRGCNVIGLTHPGCDEEIVRMDSTGRVTLLTGLVSLGQGIKTVLAQVCAETLGVPLDYVVVVAAGDTATSPFTGYGTRASRGAAVGGASVMQAATQLKQKVLRIAGHMLETPPQDLLIVDGRISPKDEPDRFVTVADVGDAANRRPLGKLPLDEGLTLEGHSVYDPVGGLSYAYGCTALMVDVDRETGVIKVLEYLIVGDCGTVINPTIVEGQLQGGAAQGLAGALMEEMVYDEQGQLLTSTFMDYLIPSASDLPSFTCLHADPPCPSPHVPGGMKGMGEGPTVGAYAAVGNAIDDALSDLGIRVATMPVTPGRMRDMIRARQALR